MCTALTIKHSGLVCFLFKLSKKSPTFTFTLFLDLPIDFTEFFIENEGIFGAFMFFVFYSLLQIRGHFLLTIHDILSVYYVIIITSQTFMHGKFQRNRKNLKACIKKTMKNSPRSRAKELFKFIKLFNLSRLLFNS